ncbi:hypothetical protein JYU34_007468 [Plutella xylostella]|uniref:Uncharacterized protein n=1 Tax=Plutella xylostella TaxID=51655 RepID=A0ABQ7QQJ3_PLUXY|nr:hypothetical protein JYU34_007468 [Plutella xylostella]
MFECVEVVASEVTVVASVARAGASAGLRVCDNTEFAAAEDLWRAATAATTDRNTVSVSFIPQSPS